MIPRPNVFDAQPPAPLGAPVGCCVVLSGTTGRVERQACSRTSVALCAKSPVSSPEHDPRRQNEAQQDEPRNDEGKAPTLLLVRFPARFIHGCPQAEADRGTLPGRRRDELEPLRRETRETLPCGLSEWATDNVQVSAAAAFAGTGRCRLQTVLDGSKTRSRHLAREVCRVVRAAHAVVLRDLRIRTHRPCHVHTVVADS